MSDTIEVRLVTSEDGYAKGCGVVLRDPAKTDPPSGELIGSVVVTGDWDLWDDGYGDSGLEVGKGDDNRYIDISAVVLCAMRGMFGLTWKEAQS